VEQKHPSPRAGNEEIRAEQKSKEKSPTEKNTKRDHADSKEY